MQLKELRFHRKISQWELGARVGISQAKVSLVERGFLSLSPDEKARVSEALGVPVDAITWTKDRRLSTSSMTAVHVTASND